MDRPVRDHIPYLKNQFGIELKPLNPVKTIISYFPNKTDKVTGDLGYFFKRGKDYCKNGYAYLAPFNTKKAFLGLVVSDVNEGEAEHFWELFRKTENINYSIVEESKLVHVSGHVYPHKVGNILFAGNTGGALSHFLGFGIFNSISMGVMAARCIVHGLDYEVLLKDVTLKNKQKHQFRRALNLGTNKGYDRTLSIVSMPPIKQLIYNSHIDVIALGAKVIKFVTKSK